MLVSKSNKTFDETIAYLLKHHSFYCLYCHGWEEKGVSSAGMLIEGDTSKWVVALHFARQALRLSEKKWCCITTATRSSARNRRTHSSVQRLR
ncbi:hypothetical protein BJ166DRAFT_534023 [Pestalotiopsis sp. NC0098]|nr:hypothetical protein BJ166DRAFT_534023 [Pestalotiopsis sp. NC0098]